MKKNVKLVYITLNDTNNNSSRKKDSRTLANGSIPSVKEKKSNFVFNKKKLNKNSIPNSNSKCYIKKTNNNKEKQKRENNNSKPKINSNLNSHSKKHQSDSKHKSLSLIKRNKNSPLRFITPGKSTPNKNINIIHNKNKNKLNSLNNNSLNNQKPPENKYNSKSKKISFFKDKVCYYKNGKILSNGKNKGEIPIYHKKIDKNKRLLCINKNKNNIINISSDNVKRSINYYKQKENIITNNSLVMKNINNNIFSSNKENKIRNIYYPRSPTSKSIHFKKEVSPIKKVSYIKKNMNENQLNENNKNSKIPSYRVFKSGNKFPNNYSYHEIVYKNSPKKIVENKKIKDEEKNNDIKQTLPNIPLRNNRPLLEELTTENNNYSNISTTILINNPCLSNLDNKIVIPYYCTLNTNKNISSRSSIRDDNYKINENICLCSTNSNVIKNSTLNPNLFLSPKVKKLDISAQYNEVETENEDIQTIHFFGEQMLNRNKNYNFNKINDIYTFPIDIDKNNELKRNNSSDNINTGQKNDKKTGIDSIPFSYNQFKWRKYHKRNENKNADLLINKNNKRYNHNIINRKKKKKLVMEKSLNEQFISKTNKNKNNDNTKDKISCCESSINLDNDSINDIIKEFEKEIEDEEKKGKTTKNSSKRQEININENNDNFVFSFISENDNNSNMSKGSTNDSKVKKRKVRYYKTKNFDMEKNYDFFLSPTKLKNKKNKIL